MRVHSTPVRPARRLALVLSGALVAATATGVALAGRPGDPPPAPPSAPDADWLADPGSAVLGFGILNVRPTRPGVPGRLTVRYEERPGDYAAFDAVQLIVLPRDAFAAGRAFADRALAFARTEKGAYQVRATISVPERGVVLVGYGPFTGPDTGRPLTLDRAYVLEVTEAEGVGWRWEEAEAGEWNVKGWTNRPEVERGGPASDAATGRAHWFEVRPQVVYERARVASKGDPEPPRAAEGRKEAAALVARAVALETSGPTDASRELRAEAEEILADVAAFDGRVEFPAALAERLRRPPLTWR